MAQVNPGRRGPWPHGQPTIVCPACHGSGIDAGRAWSLTTSHKVWDDEAARLEAIRCPHCEGRGRQTIAHALATGQRVAL